MFYRKVTCNVTLQDEDDESAILAQERRQQQQMQEAEEVQQDLAFLRDREQRVHQLEVSDDQWLT